ncbi:dTDP-4-dehydrorhamnose 3,5-epimerase [Niabella drilacis]|uniref:dTDP-4-dehydrorhamnose 3,5-epimerase n=1 Tax=Niabella drilacis (strain DSM 25811 / CCM 8410 / CCUG 62505 / LMG 26954 / E90) TaxID=1285928 RepID=A0A1G6ZEU6_NIADE|nr:dTDP-4-dehydrorhamnose 3,5-epimerase [Niabella drilacis]SDE01031.1 dTDP-4-dehydrorhamnose 3,5-epimerase [Niabella drilacis]
MIFTPTPLSGSFLVTPRVLGDHRGWFMRTFCRNSFAEIGHHKEWVQMNHSYTALKGTLRGMHFQQPPYAEIKLVRCIAGAAFDVIVDLRENSATYLQWFGAEISASNKQMLYIPEGFAHGFQALTDDVELVYCHSEFYTPAAESGVRYNDPKLRIQWPLKAVEISERDLQHPLL